MSTQIKNAPSTDMDEAQKKTNFEVIVPLICSHCDIPIDWKYDTDHLVEVDGEDVILCDSCRGEWYIHGDDFGDEHYTKILGSCPHKDWAIV